MIPIDFEESEGYASSIERNATTPFRFEGRDRVVYFQLTEEELEDIEFYKPVFIKVHFSIDKDNNSLITATVMTEETIDVTPIIV